MPEITFEVYCAKCGGGICNHVTRTDGNTIYIEPCEGCLNDAREEGKDKGYDEGYAEAKEEYLEVENE